MEKTWKMALMASFGLVSYFYAQELSVSPWIVSGKICILFFGYTCLSVAISDWANIPGRLMVIGLSIISLSFLLGCEIPKKDFINEFLRWQIIAEGIMVSGILLWEGCRRRKFLES